MYDKWFYVFIIQKRKMNSEKLIWLRETKLKKTQKELAIELKTTQDMISKIENGQVFPSIEFLTLYSNILGGSLSSLLEFIELDIKKENYNNIKINLLQCKYDIKKEVRTIEYDFNKLFNKIETNYLKNKIVSNYKIIKNINTKVANKPKVVFLGLSDSGKSSAINYFLGKIILKADWTPMTSSLVIIKHVLDKPSTLDINDNVLIFTQKNPNKIQWIEEIALTKKNLIKDEEKSTLTKKCLKGDENFEVEAGDFSLLKKCNRTNGNISENIAMAIVYVESELLEVCDIVDTPGLTSEFSYNKNDELDEKRVLKDAEKDNMMIESSLKMGDVFIFMNQINKFNDSNVNKLIMDSLKNSESNSRKTYNFFVASQADIVKNEFEIDRIIEIAKDQIKTEYEQFNKLELVIENFYPFSIIDNSLNENFVTQLKKVLTVNILEEKNSILQKNKNIILENIKDILVKEEKNLGDKKKLTNQIEAMESSKAGIFKSYDSAFSDLELFLIKRRENDIKEFRRRIENMVSIEKIHKLIISKNYSKKDVKNFLGRDIEKIYETEINLILKSTSEIFEEKVKNLYTDLQNIAISNLKKNNLIIEIPFDFEAFFASAISGLGSLIGLGFWASALGNLGQYILISKGVSLLSALGISVGGTAAAVTFVATIGGPLVIGALIAVIIGGIISLIFGSTWQTRVSKETYKKICEINLTEKFIEIIEKQYNETISLCEPLLKNLKEKYNNELMNLYEKLKSYDAGNIDMTKKDIDTLNELLKNKINN